MPWSIWVDKYGLPRQFASTLMLPQGPLLRKLCTPAGCEPIRIVLPPADHVATYFGS
jgi:hypothetical protein